jgi:hypothetical protein
LESTLTCGKATGAEKIITEKWHVLQQHYIWLKCSNSGGSADKTCNGLTRGIPAYDSDTHKLGHLATPNTSHTS